MPNLLSRGLFNLLFGSKRRAFGALPGPEPGVLGTAGDFLGPPPWQVCARYGREHGGVTLIWLGGSPGLVLNDPRLIAEVLDSRRAEFEKTSPIPSSSRGSRTGWRRRWPRCRRRSPRPSMPWSPRVQRPQGRQGRSTSRPRCAG